MGQQYQVQDIIETVNITKTGEVEKLHKVRAITTGGQQFTVDIPDKDFNEKAVKDILSDRAKLLTNIMQG